MDTQILNNETFNTDNTENTQEVKREKDNQGLKVAAGVAGGVLVSGTVTAAVMNSHNSPDVPDAQIEEITEEPASHTIADAATRATAAVADSVSAAAHTAATHTAATQTAATGHTSTPGNNQTVATGTAGDTTQTATGTDTTGTDTIGTDTVDPTNDIHTNNVGPDHIDDTNGSTPIDPNEPVISEIEIDPDDIDLEQPFQIAGVDTIYTVDGDEIHSALAIMEDGESVMMVDVTNDGVMDGILIEDNQIVPVELGGMTVEDAEIAMNPTHDEYLAPSTDFEQPNLGGEDFMNDIVDA